MPMNLLDNIFFKHALRKIALVGPCYEPLGRKACSEGMLDSEYILVKDAIEQNNHIRRSGLHPAPWVIG